MGYSSTRGRLAARLVVALLATTSLTPLLATGVALPALAGGGAGGNGNDGGGGGDVTIGTGGAGGPGGGSGGGLRLLHARWASMPTCWAATAGSATSFSARSRSPACSP